MPTVEERTSTSLTGRQTLAGAAVILLTCVWVVSLPLLVLGLVTEYGPSDTGLGWDSTTVALITGYAVVSGLLVGSSARWIARMLGRTPPSMWLIAPIVGVLALIAPFAAGWVGEQMWQRDQQAIAAACTAEDVAHVALMGQYGFEFAPAQGDPSGTCAGWIMVAGEDPDAVMATLWTRLASDGWTTSDDDPLDRTWTRDGVVLRVHHIQSSDGTTGIGIDAVG